MAKQIYANGASSLLAASISDTDLTIQVEAGYGALYPDPGADEFFIASLENADGDREYVKITARATDLLTIASGGRGQEGTTAQSWTAGQTRVEVRVTKGTLEQFIQRDGDAMNGNLDMAGHELQDAQLTGETIMTGGQLVGTAIRGAVDAGSNEILVPDDGTGATAGGSRILTVAMSAADQQALRDAVYIVGQIILWYGTTANIPADWGLCNGETYNGYVTPDLRDMFIVGAGGAYPVHHLGGAVAPAALTQPSVGAETGEHVLTIEEIPAHTHSIDPRILTEGVPDYVGPGGPTLHEAQSSPIPETGEAGGGLGHTHSIGAHTHEITTLDVRPPYHALCYIMYVGPAP